MSDDFEPDDIPDQEEAGIGDVASDVKDIYEDGKDIYNKGKENAEKSRQRKSEQAQTAQKPTNRQPKVNGSGTSSSAGSQLNREAGRQVAQEGGKQAAKEGGKQVAKEAGKQVAKEAGKKAATTAATTAASAAAGAASGGITILVELGVKAVKAVGNKVKDKLNNAGVDVDEGKKNAKRIGCLAIIGISLLPFIAICLVIYLLVHQDSKTYDVSGTVDQFVECAEAVNGTCLDFMSTGFEVKGYDKRLIQFENGPWNPFAADEVTDMTKQYIKFLKKYAVDDDAVTFDFLNVGDIEEKVTSGEELDADLALKTEQDKKTYNFKKKTMITYFRLSATSFNNIEWIMAGPKDSSEDFNIPVWDDESNLRVFGDRETYRGVLKSSHSIIDALALFAGRVKRIYIYDVSENKFNKILTKMDTKHVEERSYIDSDGATKTRKVETGLRIPEVEHIGITEQQYLQMLEPILPAWIEPMMVYSATGDWKLAQRLYDFYEEALDENPFEVGLYPIPTVTTVYVYEKHTAQTSEITGYEKMWDEDTSTYVDDLSRPIYKMVTYYGETTLNPDDIVDGDMYDITRTERDVKCSYTAVLLKGYTYDYNVDTKWSIKFGSSSMGEVVTNSNSKTVTQVDRYLIQSDGTEETPYKYIDVNGEEKEVKNRLEWYIMTHYTESQLIWKKLEEKKEEATSDFEKKSVEGYKKIFKKEGVCKDNVVSIGCSDDEKVLSFDYDIDSLAYVIQRCNEYYEKVKKDVSYSTSVSGFGTDTSEYMNYSSVPADQFVWPVPKSTHITQCYGQYESGGAHGGIDIGNEGLTSNGGLSGPIVVAARGGTVKSINAVDASYGNHVVIDHGDGYTSIYAHLYSINVTVGKTLKAGDQIGIMGTTGNSEGVHLHFEIRYNWKRVNPVLYLYGIPEGAANGKNCEDLVNENIREVQTGGSMETYINAANEFYSNGGLKGLVPVGELMSGQTYKSRSANKSGVDYALSHYKDQIVKYCKMYGVNPAYMFSVMAMESNGGKKTGWSGSACGPMQIENVHLNKYMSAKNILTGNVDRIYVTNKNILNIDTNIQLGVMHFAGKLKNTGGNPVIAAQGYNYGNTSFINGGYGISGYCTRTGTNKEKVFKDYSDVGWLYDIMDYHANSSQSPAGNPFYAYEFMLTVQYAETKL